MDCNKTIDYLQELKRMCALQDKCEDCPLGDCSTASALWIKTPKQAIEIVQKWSDEHPRKTYADDFFEKFPNAIKADDGTPLGTCRKHTYGTDVHNCTGSNCTECWNEPMEE